MEVVIKAFLGDVTMLNENNPSQFARHRENVIRLYARIVWRNV